MAGTVVPNKGLAEKNVTPSVTWCRRVTACDRCVRQPALVDRAHQGWQYSCACGHARDALAGSAGCSDHRESVPGHVGGGWSGIGAPAHTPTEIVDLLNREVNAALADPKIKGRLENL